MQAVQAQDENTIEASIVIRLPVEQVFQFYHDFSNLPRFLGDVMEIEPIDRSTSHWTIQGPFGIQVHWEVKVTEDRANELIRYATVSSRGMQTVWEIHFTRGSEAGETVVREVMTAPLGRLGLAALALIGKFPAEEVSANLHRFKELLETGRVTDTRYAVSGKFTHS